METNKQKADLEDKAQRVAAGEDIHAPAPEIFR